MSFVYTLMVFCFWICSIDYMFFCCFYVLVSERPFSTMVDDQALFYPSVRSEQWTDTSVSPRSDSGEVLWWHTARWFRGIIGLISFTSATQSTLWSQDTKWLLPLSYWVIIRGSQRCNLIYSMRKSCERNLIVAVLWAKIVTVITILLDDLCFVLIYFLW